MPSNDSSRFRVSLVQLVASALAAVTAAVAGSYLGVNGTVIGAAVASVCSVVGTAIYSHSLRRTGDRVRSAVPASARWLPDRTEPMPIPTPVPVAPQRTRLAPRQPARRLHPLARVGAAAVIVFAAALGVLTGVEIVAGRPVSDLVSGKTASGTTVFGSQRQQSARPTQTGTPTPAVTVTVTPKVVVTTPTVTSTAPAATVTSTPSGSTPPPAVTGSGSGAPTNTPGP